MLHEYGLDDFILKKHNGNKHGKDDNIKDTPPENGTKGLLISWGNLKYVFMSVLTK